MNHDPEPKPDYEGDGPWCGAADGCVVTPLAALSPRRHQVLRLVANGHTNAQIARELDIHPRTVDRHLADVYTRLGARDRAHAVAIALAIGELGVHEIFVPGQHGAAA